MKWRLSSYSSLVVALLAVLCAATIAGLLVCGAWAGSPAGDGSWEWRTPTPQGAAISSVEFGDALHGVAVGSGTVMWTEDGGDTWTASLVCDSSGPFIAAAQYGLASVAMADASTGWAVGQNQYSAAPLLLRTSDGGRTWATQDPGFLLGSLDSVAAADTSTAWAVGRDVGGRQAVLLQTTDGGASWMPRGDSYSDASLKGVACLDAERACAVGVYRTAAGHRRALILVTTDGGVGWDRRAAVPNPDFVPNAVCAVGNHRYWTAGNRTGTFFGGMVLTSTNDGRNWRKASLGNPGLDFLDEVAFGDARHGIIAGHYEGDDLGCLITENGGRSWAERSAPSAADSLDAVAYARPTRVITGGYGGYLALSVDAGAHWVGVAGLDADLRVEGASFAGGADVWLAGRTGDWWRPSPKLAHSNDGGRTWSSTDLGIKRGVFGDVAFEGTLAGWIVGWDRSDTPLALATTDGGVTWVRHPLPASPNVGVGLELIDARHAWCITDREPSGSGILRTADGGRSWVSSAPPGSPVDLRGVSFVNESDGWIAGSRSRRTSSQSDEVIAPALFATHDGGETWTEQCSPASRGSLSGVQFVDREHGWAWGSDSQHVGLLRLWVEQPILLSTSDGGSTWRSAEFPIASGSIEQAGFSDARHGWASGYAEQFSGPGDGWRSMPFVCLTDDGGATWHLLESGAGEALLLQARVDGTMTLVDFSGSVLASAIGGMPLLDLRGPFTSVAWGDPWSNKAFERDLGAIDIGRAGVAGTAWRVDEGAWIENDRVVVAAPTDHSNDGRHVVELNSWDNAGNREPVRSRAVTIDTRGPRCAALHDVVVKRGQKPRLGYRVDDELSPTVRAKLVLLDPAGRVVRKLSVASLRVCARQVWVISRALLKGRYVWQVTAEDLAGNPQERIGSAKLIVR